MHMKLPIIPLHFLTPAGAFTTKVKQHGTCMSMRPVVIVGTFTKKERNLCKLFVSSWITIVVMDEPEWCVLAGDFLFWFRLLNMGEEATLHNR